MLVATVSVKHPGSAGAMTIWASPAARSKLAGLVEQVREGVGRVPREPLRRGGWDIDEQPVRIEAIAGVEIVDGTDLDGPRAQHEQRLAAAGEGQGLVVAGQLKVASPEVTTRGVPARLSPQAEASSAIARNRITRVVSSKA